MSQVEKVSIALTAEMAGLMRRAVASGEYASSSEVVRDALRAWSSRRDSRDEAIAEIRRLWDEGVASGSPVPSDEAFERIRARIEAVSAR